MTANRNAQWRDETAGLALRLVPSQDPHSATWQHFALCAESDPDQWFPEKGGSTRTVKAICARCPVKLQCLEFALEHMNSGDPLRNYGNWGVWGGTSAEEREEIKRQREAQAA